MVWILGIGLLILILIRYVLPAPKIFWPRVLKLRTTLSPDEIKDISNTLKEEKITVTVDGYEALWKVIRFTSDGLTNYLASMKDRPVDINAALKYAEDMKSRLQEDLALIQTELDEIKKDFRYNPERANSESPTVGMVHRYEKEIYYAIECAYNEQGLASGKSSGINDAKISVLKAIAKGLQEQVENGTGNDNLVVGLNKRLSDAIRAYEVLNKDIFPRHNLPSPFRPSYLDQEW